MLVQLGLPTFDTLLHNSHVRLAGQLDNCPVLLQNSSYYVLSFLKVVNIIACVLFVVSIISFFSFLCFVSVSLCCSMGFMPEIKI